MRSNVKGWTIAAACLLACTSSACLDATPKNVAGDVAGDVAADVAGTTCTEALKCAMDKLCYGPLCLGECVANADVAVKAKLQTIGQCEADKCGSVSASKVGTLGLCVYRDCRPQVEPCTTSGSTACQATLTCIWTGVLAGTSLSDCLDQATYEGRLQALGVIACLEDKCPTAMTSQQKLVECIGNECKSDYEKCL